MEYYLYHYCKKIRTLNRIVLVINRPLRQETKKGLYLPATGHCQRAETVS